MTARASHLLLFAGVLAAIAVPAAAAAKSPRLHPFHSCAALASYARAHTTSTTPQRTDQPVAPSPAPTPKQESATGETTPAAPTAGSGTGSDASQTNVQEAGIDEPDVVKSDGQTLFAVSGGTLYAVDARADTPRILGSLELEGSDHQLLLHDGRLLVLGRGAVAPPIAFSDGPAPVAKSAMAVRPSSGQTVLSEVDARDPSAMRVVQTLRVDGDYVDARQKDAVARVVVSAAPSVAPDHPVEMPVATLARGAHKRGTTRHLVACNAVRRPASSSARII